ncbi:AP-3 complex subunit delta [Hondaea fermentalgiana]|uniref:AP-3 complex subunit delta n=1 Tax=Hondaea fermentalgiana TaxID=2315210 RepID=A0A2R5GHQ5_9STRA|nr:AP-3 complex subunit delta [Hondaea fermentalgiana]|eukprot:GBG30420.1 AP-3 complex subunit delta [Hondaea fermentalgiana]
MFEKSLQDLIKGIRNHKRDQSSYISKAMVEIKKELRSTDKHLKYLAVQKITYLQMLGVDVDFASFHIIEVMSAPRFQHRRASMLAAAQIFDTNTEVVLLTTNLIKKDLQSQNMYEAGAVLNCLSNIATRELARDLIEDVASMLNSTRPFIRKKAVLTLYKLYVRYPQGLPQTFDRLRLRLDDSDMSVVSCTVNVICELSRKNPRNFLALAPQLFQLLTTSSNNWMLIKIVKLMSSLLPEEPRLARKLLEPLAKIVESTQAKSLLYECIHAITQALPYTARPDGSQPKVVPAIVSLCAAKLRDFVKDPDQNLKYLGLVGLVNLMRSHPRVVAEHKEMVLQCLMDDDVTVRMRALELLTGMVTKRNLIDIVQKLLLHVETAEGAYRDELIDKIVYVCSREKYAFLSNFAWYVSVLVQLAHIHGAPRGKLLREQLIDVAVRVPDVRPFAARAMRGLLLDRRLALRNMQAPLETEDDGVAHTLFAASWIACEYATLIEPTPASAQSSVAEDQGEEGTGEVASNEARLPTEVFLEMASAMLSDASLSMAPFVQAAFVHNALKLVSASVDAELPFGSAGQDRTKNFAARVGTMLEPFARSEHITVQDRAVNALALLSRLNLYVAPTSADATSRKVTEEADDLLLDADLGPSDVPHASTEDAGEGGAGSSSKETSKAALLQKLFADELVPVSTRAQEKVRRPAGLDLNKPFHFTASGFEESAMDRALDEQLSAGGGALRVSFRDPKSIISIPSGPSPYGMSVEDSDASSDEGDLMLLDAQRRSGSRNSKKSKSSKHKKSSKRDRTTGATSAASESRANDPFYLPSNGQAVSSPENDLPEVPMEHLAPGSLGEEGELLDGSSSTTLRDLLSQSMREGSAQASIVVEDAMPEGALASDDDDDADAYYRKHGKRKGALNDDDLTLADIRLMSPEEAAAAEAEEAARAKSSARKSSKTASASSSKKKKSKSSKSSKSRTASLGEAGAAVAADAAGEASVKKHKKDKKDKKKKHKKSSSSSSKHQHNEGKVDNAEPLLLLE